MILFICRNNSNLPPSVPEGQEISSSPNQMQPYPGFAKPYGYPDKIRQNSPSVGAGANANNLQNLIPNLQNMNPNMQSSPNLVHAGANATTNLSLNFQNLSPIPNHQISANNSGTSPMTEHDFQRINAPSGMSGQYNGNVQVCFL